MERQVVQHFHFHLFKKKTSQSLMRACMHACIHKKASERPKNDMSSLCSPLLIWRQNDWNIISTVNRTNYLFKTII